MCFGQTCVLTIKVCASPPVWTVEGRCRGKPVGGLGVGRGGCSWKAGRLAL